jgi:hypothetical protein
LPDRRSHRGGQWMGHPMVVDAGDVRHPDGQPVRDLPMACGRSGRRGRTPGRTTGSGGVGSFPRWVRPRWRTSPRKPGTGPVARVVTAGQPHAWIAFEAVMANLRIVRPGQGRPRTRPDPVLGRQGPLLRWRSAPRCVPTGSRDHGHDPHQGRRDHRPSSPGHQRWAATGVRRAACKTRKRRRGHHQQAPPDQSSRNP